MSKQGSGSELARSTQCKKLPRMHTFKRWHYTPTEKHSTAWLHPTLPSRALAKPHHSPHLFLSLHRAALAALAHTYIRGMLLFWSEALLLHSIWHPLAHTKGDVFCASNHHANWACHQGLGFLHTSRVCVTYPCCHLSQHGPCALLYFSSHKKWSQRQPNMTMPLLHHW